ncbi:MAG: hypothetical protein IJW59_00920 [Clostridia bacterium]|nr:hypothetical protein [Clostridia bacterium]
MGLSQLLGRSEAGAMVNQILNTWIGPLFTVIGGVGAIYIVILAIQYIKSESDSKRAEAKSRIVNCVIGVLSLIIIGVVSMAVDWAKLVEIFGYTAKGYSDPDVATRLLPFLR